jgi:tetratricopeptide (TPR) repeat protein
MLKDFAKGLAAFLVPLVLFVSALGAQTDYINPHWITYGNEPVQINQTTNGRTQTLSFTDYENGMLIAELEGGVGEISLPVSETMARTLALKESPMTDVRALVANGEYTEALALLRPLAYPLIKFHRIPESFNQLHSPIRSLVNALVETGQLIEAEDVLSRIALDEVGLEYSALAITLLNALLAEGEFAKAAEMTNKIPVSGDYYVNIRPMIDAADALRAAGEFEAVIPLYEQLVGIVPENAKENIQMWLAYSLVLANRPEEATALIEQLDEPTPEKRTYSLYQLLIGSREHSQEQYESALDRLTRGYVRAQTSFNWVPEMLYLIGDCYERINSPAPARSAWTELTILYPDSPWALQAESSLSLLSVPGSNN